MIKKIEAVIRVEKLDAVIDNLNSIGCKGITVTDVKGHGKQQGLAEKYRGNTYRTDLIPKVKLEIITKQKPAKIINTIKNSAYTGNIGDGKIFVSDIEQVIRIRTGEKGAGAV